MLQTPKSVVALFPPHSTLKKKNRFCSEVPSLRMAEDFIPGFGKTVRVHDGGDLSRDLGLLEAASNAFPPVDDDDDEKEVAVFHDIDSNNAVNRSTTTLDIDFADGYGLDDLLNGYVIDEEAISAVDDALINIITEWSSIDELTSNGRDIGRYDTLMERKCPDSYHVLKAKLTRFAVPSLISS